jgi:hypothetical protein
LAGALATLLGRARLAVLVFEMLLGIAAFAALMPAAVTFDSGAPAAPAPFAVFLLGIARAAASALGAALLLGIKLATRDAALLLARAAAPALAAGDAALLLGIARAAASALGAALLLGIKLAAGDAALLLGIAAASDLGAALLLGT